MAARLTPPRPGKTAVQRWRGLEAAAQVSLRDSLLELDTMLADYDVVAAP